MKKMIGLVFNWVKVIDLIFTWANFPNLGKYGAWSTSNRFPRLWLISCTVFLGGLSFSGFAQNSIQQYLRDRVVVLDKIPPSTYTKKNFQTSWIDGVDFRTETDEFNFSRQRYLMRVAPNTSKVRTAQSNLHQLYLKKAALQKKLLRRDFVEIAYQEVIDYYEGMHKLAIKESLLTVLQDQERVLSKLIQVSPESLKDWVKVKRDIGQLEIDIYKEKETLQAWSDVEMTSIDWQDLLPAEEVLSHLYQHNTDRFHLQALVYDVDNLIIEREEALEKAEQKKILDFLQVEYNGPHTDLFNEKVSLTAGFRLPYSSSRQLKMEEIAIEKDMLQQERRAEKLLDQYQEKEGKRQLDLLIKELVFSKKQFAEQAQQFLAIAQKSSQQAGSNPLFVLYQKENNLKKELDILKLEMAIYQEYLDYLMLTEQLYQIDFYGFLSKE